MVLCQLAMYSFFSSPSLHVTSALNRGKNTNKYLADGNNNNNNNNNS